MLKSRIIISALAGLFFCAAATAAESFIPRDRSDVDHDVVTTCGAVAVGINREDGRAYEGSRPNLQVANGYWRECVIDPAPALPKPCAEEGPLTWSSPTTVCRASKPSIPVAASGGLIVWDADTGFGRGHAIFRCVNGQRVAEGVPSCAIPPACVTGKWEHSDGTTTWRWSGRLEIGKSSIAFADDGRQRPILCGQRAVLALR